MIILRAWHIAVVVVLIVLAFSLLSTLANVVNSRYENTPAFSKCRPIEAGYVVSPVKIPYRFLEDSFEIPSLGALRVECGQIPGNGVCADVWNGVLSAAL